MNDIDKIVNLVKYPIFDSNKFIIKCHNNLRKNSYFVKFKGLNTKVVTNIPQNRERLFILAFKNYEDYLKFDFNFVPKNSSELKSFLELMFTINYQQTI